MPSTVDLLPHDLAVIAALETIGKPVGFAEAPPGALEGVRTRTGPDYYCVYPLNTARDGSLGDPFTQADLIYQVTCVGRLAAGVRWLVDQLEPALHTVTVAGRQIIGVRPSDDAGVRTDFDTTPPVFTATPRYTLVSVPT
jgi:hypothetical protein